MKFNGPLHAYAVPHIYYFTFTSIIILMFFLQQNLAIMFQCIFRKSFRLCINIFYCTLHPGCAIMPASLFKFVQLQLIQAKAFLTFATLTLNLKTLLFRKEISPFFFTCTEQLLFSLVLSCISFVIRNVALTKE